MNSQRPSPRGTPLLARLLVLATAVGLSVTPIRASAQDVIALRSSATLEGTGPIRLDQIAEISGPSAQRLSAVVLDAAELVEDKQGWVAIDLDRVRGTLEKLGTENWGRLTLRGSTCNARRLDAQPAPAPKPDSPTPALAQGPTVRDVVTARLAQVFDADERNLKLIFDESDAKLLNTATAGLIADVQLVGKSERQPVSIRLYRDLTTVASGQLRVTVSIKRSVAVAIGGVRRGQSLDESTLISEERWVGPTIRPADPEAVRGQFARGRISAGQVIEVTDIEPPVVIKKGEMADVVCLSGDVSVKVKARALESGRLGERIAFQMVDSKRDFRARVEGPSRAITGTGAASDPEQSAEHDVIPASADKQNIASSAPVRSSNTAANGRSVSKSAPTTKQPPGARERARAAAKEADRLRNKFLDLGDRRLDPPLAPWTQPASVRSGAFDVTRGGPGDATRAALDRPLLNQNSSEDRE